MRLLDIPLDLVDDQIQRIHFGVPPFFKGSTNAVARCIGFAPKPSTSRKAVRFRTRHGAPASTFPAF
jgi:hypothetical protein